MNAFLIVIFVVMMVAVFELELAGKILNSMGQPPDGAPRSVLVPAAVPTVMFPAIGFAAAAATV